MRASVHVALPRLAHGLIDLKAMCREFGLSVCGAAGDHTPVGDDDILGLSPTRRLFVRERDIIETPFAGIGQLSLRAAG